MKAWTILLPLVAGLCASGIAEPPTARACYNTVRLDTKKELRRLKTADTLLARGRSVAAARIAMRFTRRHGVRKWPKKDLLRRARRIIAVAVVRERGKLPLFEYRAPTTRRRKANLADAHATLKAQLSRKPGSPWLKARLAESHAVQASLEEARVLLVGLAKKDLMPDVAAWSLLAALERAAGNTSAADAATKRCEAITGKKRRRACRRPPVRIPR